MKNLLINLTALFCALLLFCVSSVFSATRLQVAEVNVSLEGELSQEEEEGLAEILEENEAASSQSGEESSSDSASSEASSSQGVSSAEASSEASSKEPASSTASKEPTSSATVPSGGISEETIQIIAGAVQAEIIGSNSTPNPQYYEAYKAQAVACHSFMEYNRITTGKFPKMSYRPPHAKTIALVREVADELVYVGPKVVCTYYHASSGGHTQSSKYVWGGVLSHLVGVESSYDADTSSFTISEAECKEKLTKFGLNPSGAGTSWFDLGSAEYSDGGFVTYMNVCGVRTSVRALREDVFGGTKLRSTKITQITVANGQITFTTKGYGHGVGMSQKGALGYSAAGWSYQKILKHYYTGITIK